ncbi:hypothetical protein R1sor_015379 [Riccia sorocarpa]|uniref:Uncharacterized protein n=1 Tax=Riccia sorocarpa TaxID=122646 RepID=A0ABD3HC30_9MARC
MHRLLSDSSSFPQVARTLGRSLKAFQPTIQELQLLSSKGIVGRVQEPLRGVGAPEALVIAVVPLLVFGPKGLAKVARTLGRSLKAFQPTIQELQLLSSKGIVGRVQAPLLGVGAPEALVIAVVALLVFGPKGLAEVRLRSLAHSLQLAIAEKVHSL